MRTFSPAGRRAAPAKVELQLTPLIDVVFQLLAFFLVTFRVAAVEGDFQLRLPKVERGFGGHGPEQCSIRLIADERGDLELWRLDMAASGNGTGSLPRLRGEAAARVAAAREAGRKDPDFELRFDDRLRYEHLLEVVGLLTGEPPPDARHPQRVRKLRLAVDRP